MIRSMTAFASRTGQLGPVSWNWEMRGVNARGLDIRCRLPEGIEGLEAAVKTELGKSLARGSVTVNLRLTHEEVEQSFSVDADQLDATLRALEAVQERAFEMGVTLAQPTAADVLMQRGVMVSKHSVDRSGDLPKELVADIAPLTAAFVQMRRAEGEALLNVISGQLDQIEALLSKACEAAAARVPQVRDNLAAALHRVVEDVPEIDEARLAQELALIAVKSDVTEEIDRLNVHVAAARKLIAGTGPAGRKLDFLAQEFNREANTLCSKAQSSALTAIGLDLKAVIDQMREQIQNVE